MAVLESETGVLPGDQAEAPKTANQKAADRMKAVREAKQKKKLEAQATSGEVMMSQADALAMIKQLVEEERAKIIAEFQQRDVQAFANAFVPDPSGKAVMSKPVSSVDGMRHNPRKNLRFDPNMHYLKIQGDSPDYVSNLQAYLDIVSPTNPDYMMYKPYSNDAEITGSKVIHLLCCTKADYDARLRDEHAAGIQRQGKLDPIRKQMASWAGLKGDVEVGDAFYGLEEDYMQKRGVLPA